MARVAVCLLFLLAFCAFPVLRAGPVPARDPFVAVFARSCGECPSSAYCEFGYPGAPEGGVACVQQESDNGHVLYRRYEPVAGQLLVIEPSEFFTPERNLANGDVSTPSGSLIAGSSTFSYRIMNTGNGQLFFQLSIDGSAYTLVDSPQFWGLSATGSRLFPVRAAQAGTPAEATFSITAYPQYNGPFDRGPVVTFNFTIRANVAAAAD
ncbi:hypothetical protein DFJ74DRAFT_2166 [Hyaloraphidium curvatum]|nr:hypothetical protein DFJ74DRAFT_2166 [Hyaloraphidium curvatum]